MVQTSVCFLGPVSVSVSVSVYVSVSGSGSGSVSGCRSTQLKANEREPQTFPKIELNGMNWNERNVLNEKRREKGEEEREAEKCFVLLCSFKKRRTYMNESIMENKRIITSKILGHLQTICRKKKKNIIELQKTISNSIHYPYLHFHKQQSILKQPKYNEKINTLNPP